MASRNNNKTKEVCENHSAIERYICKSRIGGMSPMVRILIVGAGRVGAPLAAWLATHPKRLELGIQSISVSELNPQIRDWFTTASYPWPEPGMNEAIEQGINEKILHTVGPTSELPRTDVFDMAFICVGTPVEDGEPQLAHIKAIARDLQGTQLILRSTVPPGTSDEIAALTNQPVIHAPERLLLGTGMSELNILPQILGTTAYEHGTLFERHMLAFDVLTSLFSGTTIGSAVEAELAKICNNTVRYIEFAVGTELSMLMTHVGANPAMVRKMMTDNYSRGRLSYPSFVGSYCLDKDWQMLAFKGLHSKFAFEAFNFNQNLFKELTERIIDEHQHIGILGLTYKPEQDDTRSSISWELMKWLKDIGKSGVMIHDPLVKLTTEQELEYGACSVDSYKTILESCSLIYVMTAHAEYGAIRTNGQTFVDPAGIIQVGNGYDFVRSDD